MSTVLHQVSPVQLRSGLVRRVKEVVGGIRTELSKRSENASSGSVRRQGENLNLSDEREGKPRILEARRQRLARRDLRTLLI